ncbi:class I SAM-dependent methyltransferase [Rhizobium ruizarguesonis]|nr:class I SAM-dependent methyltransferase [Rhizobium leguminosarum]TAT81243.1 class I SAM-dependent methyltransferase [Rhizobium ruizarguesonis]TBD24178.1 class I SAM-dependent methyltransferase [Rhizobium ruizarguesonis]
MFRKKHSLPEEALQFNCAEQTGTSWNERANIAAELIRKAAFLDSTRWLSIADIGCGDGKLEAAIAPKLSTFTYQGYDLHPQAKRFLQLDIKNDPLPREFDIVVLLGVLEYLPDIQPVLRELCRKCRYFVVSHTCNPIGVSAEQIERRNWITLLSKEQFDAELDKAGFINLDDVTTSNTKTTVWLCRGSLSEVVDYLPGSARSLGH